MKYFWLALMPGLAVMPAQKPPVQVAAGAGYATSSTSLARVI